MDSRGRPYRVWPEMSTSQPLPNLLCDGMANSSCTGQHPQKQHPFCQVLSRVKPSETASVQFPPDKRGQTMHSIVLRAHARTIWQL